MRDFEGNITYAVYSQFSVDSPANDYKLSLGEYSGTSGMLMSLCLLHRVKSENIPEYLVC